MQHTALWSELQPLVERRCAERGGARRVAALAGLSPAQLSRYRNGRQAPSIEVLARLAKGFGYRVEFDLVPANAEAPASPVAGDLPGRPMTPTLDQVWRRVARLLKAKLMRTQGGATVLAAELGVDPLTLARHLEGVPPDIELVNLAAQQVGMSVHIELLPAREDTAEFLQMLRQVMVLGEAEQVALLEISRRLQSASDGSRRVVMSHLDAALKELRYLRGTTEGE